jgi:predicted MPP superfamily phosphohydrolase
MSTLPGDVLNRIRAYSHYRDADYDALEAMVGAKRLEQRLRVQLQVYDRVQRYSGPLRKWVWPVYRGCIRAGLYGMGQYAKSRHMARTPEVVEREEIFAQLPAAFDGFRVLHLSDFHFDFIPEMPVILEKVLHGLEFDLCVLTGDYRGEVYGPYEESLTHLKACRPFLGQTVYAVLGNHDNVEILTALPEMDIQVLYNSSCWIERGGQRFLLAGIDDPHMYRTHDYAPFRPMVEEADFTLLLSHSPEACFEAEREGVDWMLSGHTHGGQICLPGGFPLIAHIGDAPKSVIRGPWQVGNVKGYTTRGVGTSTVDCRWNCRPEITVHTLRKSS